MKYKYYVLSYSKDLQDNEELFIPFLRYKIFSEIRWRLPIGSPSNSRLNRNRMHVSIGWHPLGYIYMPASDD